ncbi:MAG: ribosomal RNA small subunit methyltransferase A [Candidatus Eremiobacteraeota bacterium]|nr:ribosomal RNA small subunit methyltransferase A [Candidatus Eremiobacteraeota bacterium]
MTDRGALQRIADLCVPQTGERIVEVGAGTGALTCALLERGARVTALEIDANLVAALREREDLSGVDIVEADALAFDYEAAVKGERWCAAGNLPYNIATPLIGRWLQAGDPPQRIVAMLQRDVADRLGARPGTPQYGSFSLVVAYAMTVRRAFILPPSAFYPRPKVDSAVVVMDRRPTPAVAVRDPVMLLQVVRGAFAYRRKTLANSLALALGIERTRTQNALAALDVDTEIRAEQLDLGAFAALADFLGE